MSIQTLAVGTPAPDFSGKDQNGNTVSLSDFKGSNLILYFYPKDDTPGCTKEACNLRDNYDTLLQKGYKVLGVSMDDEASHKKFADKFQLPFPLLADTDKKVLEAYGAYGEKTLFGKTSMGTHRITYVIDGEGKIQEVFTKVKTEDHAAQILKTKK